MAVRRIAVAVMVLLVVAGIWIGTGGDERMRLFTAGVFGLCALSIAWKLWRDRGRARLAEPHPAPDGGGSVAAHPSAPDAADVARSGPWRVYGRDTFAREDYFVGEFDTEAEARECVRRKLERLARFQDEPLRDEIWVEPPDSRFRMRE